MTEYKWRDIHGDSGRLSSDPDDLIISIELHEGKEGYAAHDIPIAEARALHEALGRALAEVGRQPVTDSISATLAACSAPVPDILRKIDAACGESHLVNVVHGPDGTRVYRTPDQSAPDIIRVHPTGTGDHGSIDVTTDDGLTRYAVQQVPRSLRSISTEELAKLGLKPKAHFPSDGYLLECGHWSIHKQWCTECAADIVAISQRASHPEPHPTGNGDLVTPPLLEALADYPELAVLVSARYAFGRSKYGTGLRTHNGRDPLEDARQELGGLLQYLWQAKMEGRDIHSFLDLWSSAYTAVLPSDEQYERVRRNMLEYVEAVRDVTTGSKPSSRARADELYTAIKQDMLDGDPRMGTVDRLHEMMGPSPTLHLRPFFWDSNERFGFVNVAQDDIPEGECMTVSELLAHIPNALDAHESHHPLNPTEFPNFGFRLEHDGPRTLREYLEAP